jgi:hypothetical protein
MKLPSATSKNSLVFYRSRTDTFPKEPFGSAQGAENAKRIVVLYTHTFFPRAWYLSR